MERAGTQEVLSLIHLCSLTVKELFNYLFDLNADGQVLHWVSQLDVLNVSGEFRGPQRTTSTTIWLSAQLRSTVYPMHTCRGSYEQHFPHHLIQIRTRWWSVNGLLNLTNKDGGKCSQQHTNLLIYWFSEGVKIRCKTKYLIMIIIIIISEVSRICNQIQFQFYTLFCDITCTKSSEHRLFHVIRFIFFMLNQIYRHFFSASLAF